MAVASRRLLVKVFAEIGNFCVIEDGIIMVQISFLFIELCTRPARNAKLIGRIEVVVIIVVRIGHARNGSFHVIAQCILLQIVSQEFPHVDTVSNIIIAILIGVHAESDSHPVLSTMGSNVGNESVITLDFCALKVLFKFIFDIIIANIVVDFARVVLGADRKGIEISQLTLLQLPLPSLLCNVIKLAIAVVLILAPLNPLLIDFVGAFLAVFTVRFESFFAVFRHNFKIVLELEHVLSIVGGAPLSCGTSHLALVSVFFSFVSLVVLVSLIAVLLVIGSVHCCVVVVVATVPIVVGIVVTINIVIVLYIFNAITSFGGAKPEDGKVFGRKHGLGIFLSGHLVVILLHFRTAQVTHGILCGIESKGVIPIAVG
mmetsp:Transcript_10568/g.22552  ORF Transcript_10568/g.22552 Transcript_10568/m.22552 type:complete len:373 (-) Transcript_10568:288-1406(-)